MVILKSIVIWLVFILVESLNGAIREFGLVPLLGDRPAHLVSFVTGSIIVLAIATLFIRWLNVSHPFQLLRIGLLWLGLTVGFEIILGRFILGYSWSQIGADYDLLHGGLMPLGLAWLWVSPLLAAKIRGVSVQT